MGRLLSNDISAPKGRFGNLRFVLRYEPIALDVYLAIFQAVDVS